MASLCNFITMVLLLLIGSVMIASAKSLTCTSQKFQNRAFAQCDDLPHLNAFIHWTYNSTNSSLSIAFQAPPPKPDGWVAWAINPTSTGMEGSQALIAFRDSKSVPTVRFLNISTYSSIVLSPKLSFDVWDLSAEDSDGNIKIFATVKIPAKAKSVNQVWQVGSIVNVTSGQPSVHDFKPDNLNSKGVLHFVKTSGGGHASAPGPAPSSGGGGNGTTAAAPAPSNDGISRFGRRNLGFVVGLFVFIWGVFNF